MTRKFHYIYASVSNFVHDLCGKFVLDLNGLHIIQNGDDYLLKLDYQIAVASHNPLHSFNTIIKLADKDFDNNYQFKFIECLSWDTRYFNSVRNSFTSFKII